MYLALCDQVFSEKQAADGVKYLVLTFQVLKNKLVNVKYGTLKSRFDVSRVDICHTTKSVRLPPRRRPRTGVQSLGMFCRSSVSVS